ncbi:MAG TPA: patatin-like phospholipase family protein [Acidimicrobiales bacterium]|nr:patatin-like phospholipase family protein [Acidimicrobiales bacterium]
MRVGLVLGGGGVIGMAYHAAALAAIEHDLDWDPNDADVVVGTSAGSVVGALLRRGVPASDLATIAVGAEPRSSPPAIARALRDRAEFPPVRALTFLAGPPRLPSPALVTAWLRRPWRLDPVTAVASVIPDGKLDLAEHASALHELLGSPWPDRELWVCAVRRHDLRRVVLGRDIQPRLAEAVAASCAIPGYFRPVDVDGVPYIDGGVRSPTNADVLRRAELDLAIILSPMSGRGLGGLNVGSLVRRHARGKVEAERARLHAAGTATLLIEPGPEVIEALGRDFMSDARVADIVRTAYVDTGDQLRQPAARDLLADLIEGSRAEPAAPGRLRRPRWRGDRAWRRWQAR